MRIAVTSQNFRTITGHAGKSRRFLVFQADEKGEPKEVDRLGLPREMSFHEFRGEGGHPVDQAAIVITASCGAGFVHRLATRGIQVVATSESDPLQAVRALLRDEPLSPPAPHEHDHGPAIT